MLHRRTNLAGVHLILIRAIFSEKATEEIHVVICERIVRSFHRDKDFNHARCDLFYDGCEAGALLHISRQRAIVHLDVQWRIFCPVCIFSVA